jgi:DNA-binding response OmpR family regulator
MHHLSPPEHPTGMILSDIFKTFILSIITFTAYNKSNGKKGRRAMDQPLKATVLVVDDDREIAAAIQKLLEREGYTVLVAYDGMEALDQLTRNKVQLMLLDVMMPRMDGLSATMRIRQTRNIPIIILSAKSEDSDKILGLSMGADDYVTKPFNPPELLSRVNSQLRRYMLLGDMGAGARGSALVSGGLALDTDAKQLTVDGRPTRLTATEYRIVELLMQNLGRVFSSEEIYERVWNEDAFAVENTVMVHIRRIREKIEINPKDPKYLKVVWGIGYKIEKI